MSVETVLDEYFTSKKPAAIVLQGRWGVGKTHFWQQEIVPALFKKPWKVRYSYLSLFGINSLPELKIALAVATRELDHERRKEKRKASKWVGWFWRSRAWLSDALGLVPNIGPELSKLHDKISFYLLRDRIICFDDIERHSLGLDLKDFLGLVTYLVDIRNCQVVVILNSGQLGTDQSTWNDHREKVFEGELTYAPSQDKTIALGLKEFPVAAWHEAMRQSWVKLGVVNIRLVRRAATYMLRALQASEEHLRPDTVDHMARAVVLLTYALHGKGEGAPPVGMIMQHGRYVSAMLEDKDLPPEHVQWRKIIREYGLLLHTPLDQTLRFLVEHGYSDKNELSEAISEFEANAKSHAAKDAWHDAWQHYHGTVQENGDEILQAFQETWPPVSEHESVSNLESLVRLLRLLGRADLATEYIQTWVGQRSGIRISELEPRELHLFRQIEDEEILAAIEQARGESSKLIDLQAAYDTLRSNQNYDLPALREFAAATPREIVQLLEANPGDDLTSTVKWLLNLPENPNEPDWKRASQNVRLACQVIASRSALSADRMKNWFGIASAQGSAAKPEQEDGPDEDTE